MYNEWSEIISIHTLEELPVERSSGSASVKTRGWMDSTGYNRSGHAYFLQDQFSGNMKEGNLASVQQARIVISIMPAGSTRCL